MTDRLFEVGKIVNTHGIKGEVKVLRISDFEERFKPGNILYLTQGNKQIVELEVASHRQHKGFDLLQFKGYENINDVEHFKGDLLNIKEEQLTDLDEDEFYYHEIIGCEVYLDNGEKLGTIKEILSPGANDVWVVKQQKGKDILVPYIEDVVKEVEPEDGKVIIKPMEGLLD
ncbi:ribosome maturation factor RimM [Virgibacillus kekensis]|uniref:Ribosome maturation factor RimM n=1 Tax=Virgibacillus kekensis TaxID=202261 RepID=A0ABV9DG98_9BACI